MSSIGEADNLAPLIKDINRGDGMSTVLPAVNKVTREDHPPSELPRRIMIKRSGFSEIFNKFVENLNNSGKDTKKGVAMLVDFLAATTALAFAYLLRLSGIDIAQLWPAFIIVPVLTVLIFSRIGVYGMVIRFSGLDEMTPIVKGVIASSLLTLVTLFLLAPEPNPRSMFVIYGLLLLVFCGCTRHMWRWIASDAMNISGVPIAIYGAGALGRQVMQICRNGSEYRPVLWLDDDRKIHGRTLAQAKVLDPQDPNTPEKLKKYGVETILMAIPHVKGSRMKELLESLQSFNCVVKSLPSIEDIMANRVTSRDIQTLPLEELIGRKQIAPDATLMSKNITGKVVMVTGAGGSVGSELCRQIIQLKPTAIVLFDVSEAALYLIDSELRKMIDSGLGIAALQISSVLGNVVFKDEVAHVIKSHGVKTLFHAAAYKHVPMVEKNPQPAIRTNVFGTLATLEAATENGVENFMLVSTDKAVRPTNIMGATKRIAEMVVQATAVEPDCKTKLSMVRFGNVIGSSGSVVPKFSEQIEAGGPITVTHSEVERFFMSIPEAAQLVIQASSLAEGGDVFLLDMGKPIRISDLAKSLIYLHGKTLRDNQNPKGDIEIVYTGLREGEKLYEELLIDALSKPTVHAKISRAKEEFLDWQTLMQFLEGFKLEMDNDPNNLMVESLKTVVKGYQPNRSDNPETIEITLEKKGKPSVTSRSPTAA